MPQDAAPFVHEHGGRYIVAAYYGDRYYAYIRPALRRATGEASSTIIRPSLDDVAAWTYTYARRADAVRRARELYANPELF